MPDAPRLWDFPPADAKTVITVSGTLTNVLAPAVKDAIDAHPDATIIAVGACACIGGPYWDSYSVAKGLDQFVRVDHYIAGCPPPPQAITAVLAQVRGAFPDEGLRSDQYSSSLVEPPREERADVSRPARDIERTAATEQRFLSPDEWVDAVAQARTDGFTWYNLLTAHDDIGRSNDIVVTLRLANPDTRRDAELIVAVDRDRPELGDIAHLFAGAAWGQRYVHDFYGVRFAGADLRPLLNHDGGAPLRKDVVLGARAVTPHPAGDDRRGRPPGVPDPAVWGNRDPELPPPAPDELVGAMSSRRRRR